MNKVLFNNTECDIEVVSIKPFLHHMKTREAHMLVEAVLEFTFILKSGDLMSDDGLNYEMKAPLLGIPSALASIYHAEKLDTLEVVVVMHLRVNDE